MNKKLIILMVAMVILDIIDGDFNSFSILDIIKTMLYIVCFTLLIIKKKRGLNELR